MSWHWWLSVLWSCSGVFLGSQMVLVYYMCEHMSWSANGKGRQTQLAGLSGFIQMMVVPPLIWSDEVWGWSRALVAELAVIALLCAARSVKLPPNVAASALRTMELNIAAANGTPPPPLANAKPTVAKKKKGKKNRKQA